MNVEETVAFLKLTVTDEQRRAMRYLERRGQRFCLDFGYDNAVEKARADWRKQHQRKRRSTTTTRGGLNA